VTTERWLPVVGYEGLYEVSDFGLIRSIPRFVRYGTRGHTVRGRILAQTSMQGGYFGVNLSRDGHAVVRSVGVLVLTAFVGPKPPGLECCHFNDRQSDNSLTNLRWDTRSANAQDNVRNGNHPNARKTHCPRNHAYTPENTIVRRGRRHCRACKRELDRRRGHPERNKAGV
jgi:hypothetical protein